MATEALRAVAEQVDCAHCGLAVPAGLVPERVSAANPAFCCSGCRTAWGILHEYGLDRYYGFADRREAPVRSTGRSYEEFDHPAFTDRYVTRTSSGLASTELYLEGVHCASCVWLVERMPIVLPGVARAELDIRRSLAVVEWDDATLKLSDLARRLDQLGYPPHPFRGVTRDAMRKREDRAALTRIGIAGAIAINVMLPSLALYAGEASGMDRGIAGLFRYVSFALVAAAYAWPGRVFFTGAMAALRTRSLHMDLPIAIALAAGFVQGAVNTVTGEGPVFFDGLSVLIFLLLVGRFLQQRGQRLATDSAELLHAIAPVASRIVEGDAVRDIPSDALLPGMIVEVRAGETFGADAVLLEGEHSTVNVSLLTGESRPVAVHGHEAVYAGTLNVESPVRARVTASGEESRIAKILRQVDDSARRRAPVVVLANRLSGVFVGVILTLALALFLVKLRFAPARALDDAIALLVVTCPCALAMATPLAITIGVGRAARRGILVKGGDALELLSTPATLVLDKTGTVTQGVIALAEWQGPEWVKPLVLSLEQGSSHPLAEGFRRTWPDVLAVAPEHTRHVVGGGIEGRVCGHDLRIGSPRFVAAVAGREAPGIRGAIDRSDRSLTPVHIAVDGELVAVAGLGDVVRADARQALDTLRARGWRTVMLSGDAPEVVASVASRLGFSPEDALAERSPESKLAFVESLKARGERVVMVGDGVNDAAAIAAANVGIGVHGGAESCLATADIYLARPGLDPLVELTEGSRNTMRVIRRNMGFSLAYNAIGIALAVAGLLTPLVAAIMMPVSSVTVILGSWYGRTFARTLP